MNGEALLAIGELARRTGVSVKTIRYWSDLGLVPTVGRTSAGYRLYDEEAASRLSLVRTLRALGIGLDTVGAVLAREATLPEVAAAHAEALADRIRDLRLGRAVLTVAAEDAAGPEDLEELHRLTTLTAPERHDLINDFLTAVLTPEADSADPNTAPGDPPPDPANPGTTPGAPPTGPAAPGATPVGRTTGSGGAETAAAGLGADSAGPGTGPVGPGAGLVGRTTGSGRAETAPVGLGAASVGLDRGPVGFASGGLGVDHGEPGPDPGGVPGGAAGGPSPVVFAGALTPELPGEPTAGQVRAWAELAGLVRDPGFRAVMREAVGEHLAEHPVTAPPREDAVAAAIGLAAPALAAHTDPASPEAAPVADALAARQAALLGRADGPGLRHAFAARLARAADPRRARYFRLLAVVNGWPTDGPDGPERQAAALDWCVQALRTVRTDTLVLRPWRDEDAPAVAAAHRDPALRHWATRRIEDEAGALDWIRAERRAWTEGTRHAFAVVGGQGRVLGGVVLKSPGEVGYWTAPEARGRSVASRGLEALTDWAFTALGPDAPARLELLHQADNLASCRVAEKCAYGLSHHLPPAPPAYPREGHVHVREREP